MTTPPGRNDPCHCGSGKKYKHCHLREDEAAPGAVPTLGPEGAAELALAWLTERHRKAFKAAVEALFDGLWPEEAESSDGKIDSDTWQTIQINLTEWLLAEGEFQVKGEWREINDYLTGPDGPRLTDGQRGWLAQMSRRPLRLYRVTDVRPADGLTLCDALDTAAPPRVVQERMGSRSATPGMLIGARIMTVGDHLELSGAIYPFSMLAQPGAMAAARAVDNAGFHPEDIARLRGQAIASAWIRQFVVPPELPKMVDMTTGEPLLLVTDHYRVLDAAALAQALAACADVAGDARSGWRRELECDDGATRSLAAINPGKSVERIEVFYRTQRYADEGREWFEGIAGAAVRHLTREISDPRGMLRSAKPGRRAAAPATPPSLSPDQMADAIEQALRRSYARWADEPIPLLDNKTPRQAMQTPAGLERVKGLLRSYESGEADMAAKDKRRAISYQFLWDSLGITR
jgi:hypothetical protein